ncbi:ABC transporter ATP-binding protein [Devosia sp. FKR38]|uniref:ABC transporter ATP-binding protein n=1 Tax=Devosia sp. FKR38 TaxID=2562312 RepID=UPI0010BF9D44|nr:ABC transporter ATP-binding protein [Devosia sp. FKR38]
MISLALRGLAKSFAGTTALAGIDLTIAPGELVTLLGPSGCGKSTLLRLIAGLDIPDQGAILIDGRDISDLDVPERNVGLVFQRYALFPHMTVRRNIGFGLRVRGTPAAETERRVSDMLDIVQLGDLGERFAHQLSGGQMQRVALARTLVTRPRLLMLDEPFAALDADLRRQMRSFVRDLQQKMGLSTIFVTHDQAEAMEISDRIAVMQSGRILQCDTPEMIYHQPVSAEVARMTGEANLVTGRVVSLGDAVGLDLGFDPVPLPRRGLAAGTQVLTLIRPEAIAIAPADPGDGHGVIQSSAFMGQSVRYSIAVGPNVFLVDDVSTRRLAPGQWVSLRVSPDHVCVFPPQASQP